MSIFLAESLPFAVFKIEICRCVDMIASLFHTPLKEDEQATGTACIGSSEAIMLGTLALKRKWEERRKKEGKPTDKPNLVMGYNVQVVSFNHLLLSMCQIDLRCWIHTLTFPVLSAMIFQVKCKIIGRKASQFWPRTRSSKFSHAWVGEISLS